MIHHSIHLTELLRASHPFMLNGLFMEKKAPRKIIALLCSVWHKIVWDPLSVDQIVCKSQNKRAGRNTEDTPDLLLFPEL